MKPTFTIDWSAIINLIVQILMAFLTMLLAKKSATPADLAGFRSQFLASIDKKWYLLWRRNEIAALAYDAMIANVKNPATIAAMAGCGGGCEKEAGIAVAGVAATVRRQLQ